MRWLCRMPDLSGVEGQVQAAALLEKDLQAHILQLVGACHDGHSLQKIGQVGSRHVPSHNNTANLQHTTSGCAAARCPASEAKAHDLGKCTLFPCIEVSEAEQGLVQQRLLQLAQDAGGWATVMALQGPRSLTKHVVWTLLRQSNCPANLTRPHPSSQPMRPAGKAGARCRRSPHKESATMKAPTPSKGHPELQLQATRDQSTCTILPWDVAADPSHGVTLESL